MTKRSYNTRVTQIILGITLIAALLIGGLVSCAPTAPKGLIKIGSLQPTTGTAAFLGQQCEKGFALGFEEYNYEVAGRKIEVIYEDTAGIPDTALTKGKKLVEKDEVNLLFGPFLRHCEAPIDEYLKNTSWIPLISPGGGEMEKFPGYAFSVGGHFSDEAITVPFAEYAYNKMGWRKGIVLGSDYLWGHACMDSFARGFGRAGGQILEFIPVPLGTMDMSPYLEKIKAKANEADFVYDFIIVADSVRFHRQYVEQGITLPRWSNGEGVTSHGLIQQTGLAAVGAYGIFTWVYECQDLFPSAKKFTDAYSAKYNIDADYFALCGYQGAKWIWYALNSINGNAEDREALLNALKTVRIPKEDNAIRDGEFYLDPDFPCPILDGYVCIVKEVNGQPKLEIIDVIKDIRPIQLTGPREYK